MSSVRNSTLIYRVGSGRYHPSFSNSLSKIYLPKPKIDENFQRHHLLINGSKRRTWNKITISTVYARSLGQFNGQVYTRWMNRLERMKGRSNWPKNPRADLIAFKKWLMPLSFLTQIRVIQIPNPTRYLFFLSRSRKYCLRRRRVRFPIGA
jgi:hypothetical protein